MKVKSFAIATSLALSASVWALPATTVNWVQRTGSTSGTEPVEVWLRLTVTQLDAGPLFLDGTSSSFSEQDFANIWQRGFDRINTISNGANVPCGNDDTFFPQPPLRRCSDTAAAWRFQFNHGADGFIAQQAMPLAPGESRDYLYGTFTPRNGPVAPGLYSLSTASMSISVTGNYANGDFIAYTLNLGETCGARTADCAFTRVVTAVPEPETHALMGLGLMATIAIARRRNRHKTVLPQP